MRGHGYENVDESWEVFEGRVYIDINTEIVDGTVEQMVAFLQEPRWTREN